MLSICRPNRKANSPWILLEIHSVVNIKTVGNHLYTAIWKFVVDTSFKMFLKEVSYAQQGCIYLSKNIKTVILSNILTI